VSRAFVKDESWEEPLVAPRAPLPDGTPNYVTARGLRLLREEQAGLEARQRTIEADAALDDGERRRRQSVLTTRLRELLARIASAQVVPAGGAGDDAARFGAEITLRSRNEERRLRIVGVDEADPEEGRVAFTSPIAQAVLGLKVGQTARLRAAGGEEILTIEGIAYPED
jgi:transcription elongation factor GreB